jgi:HPt (histidine-containing phosphotransfer) domain-containing protein
MPHIQLDYLELMTQGDRELQQTMLGMLLEELPEAMQSIQTLFAAGNQEEMHGVCHKLKATLPFVGNAALESTNKMLEEAAKSGDRSGLAASLVESMASLLPPVLQELREAMGRM